MRITNVRVRVSGVYMYQSDVHVHVTVQYDAS